MSSVVHIWIRNYNCGKKKKKKNREVEQVIWANLHIVVIDSEVHQTDLNSPSATIWVHASNSYSRTYQRGGRRGEERISSLRLEF